MSKEGEKWAEFVWRLEFGASRKKTSIAEIKATRRLEVEQKFLKVVLKETQTQRHRVEKLSKQLGKYLPPQIHSSMIAEEYDSKIMTKRKKLTIFPAILSISHQFPRNYSRRI